MIDEPKKGGVAPDPSKSDLGRTDDVPKETAGTPGGDVVEGGMPPAAKLS